ncbi:MAG: NERD domain-containing protein [Chloroflexota bacterium]|nr:NERD domain-containing protein [Chloroflexota bacterium]MDQ5865983.1 NERD domain-containing protein [Chloroflexota bacterium]
MNVFTHESTDLRIRLRRARIMQYSGLLSLIASIFCSIYFYVNPILVFFAYPLLILGFPLWTTGRNRQKQIKNVPRINDMLTNELKGLSDKYSLHHGATVEGRKVEHLLITPSGVIVLAANEALGPVHCTTGRTGDRWQTRLTLLDRFSGARPPIGNPSLELDTRTAAVKAFLAKQNKENVPVRGLVVFLANPDIEIEESTYPAVPLNELRLAVRELQAIMAEERETESEAERLLTSEDRRRFNAALGPATVTKAAQAQAPARPASARS